MNEMESAQAVILEKQKNTTDMYNKIDATAHLHSKLKNLKLDCLRNENKIFEDSRTTTGLV